MHKAVIVGVGPDRGLGAGGWAPQLCKRFAKQGLHVVAAGRTPASLDAVVADIETSEGEASSFVADATKEADVAALLKQNPDGTYGWKFDPYLCGGAPYRLSLEDHIGLWSRIACSALLVSGSESFLPDPATAGVISILRTLNWQGSRARVTGFNTTSRMKSSTFSRNSSGGRNRNRRP
jgi:NAD(P)-dependent dehydrogenase (short-subunit alcohol dehydrogenase family)